MQEIRFIGNEIVRLKQDHLEDGLKAGDCGIVWGSYVYDPLLYEAAFLDQYGKDIDLMFDEDEVEEVFDIKETPFPKELKDMRQLFNGVEAKLQQ